MINSINYNCSCIPTVVPVIQPESGLPDYTVNEMEAVTFECSATGIPPPTITWYRDGVLLSGDRVTLINQTLMDFTRMDNENVQMVTRMLTLANTNDGDSGNYTCNATNTAGEDLEEFELVVQSEFYIAVHCSLAIYDINVPCQQILSFITLYTAREIIVMTIYITLWLKVTVCKWILILFSFSCSQYH